jgi:autotransporter passenger strand-loop-strand repeat protein
MTIVSSGHTQFVSSGQLISGTTVLKGGEQYIYSGGTAESTVVSAGGHLVAFGEWRRILWRLCVGWRRAVP